MKIKQLLFYCALLILLLLSVSFAVLNAAPVSVNYYIGAASLPLSLLLVYVLGIGIILGFFSSLMRLIKLKYTNRTLRNKLNATASQEKTLDRKTSPYEP